MNLQNIKVHDFERIDDLHRNGYMLIQNPQKFCFGVDAVLLSDFAKIKKDAVVLDLCTGNGVIPILLCGKSNAKKIIGIEIQEESVDLARRSVELNNLEDRIEIINDDLKKLNQIIKHESVDCITVNPPYMNEGGGILNENDSKTIARHEILCNLEDVISQSVKVLKYSASFFMIHRPQRLTDIISLMRNYKLEPKTLRFVHPYENKEPTMVLIEGVKGGKPMLKVLPPLINYNKDGTYTDEIKKIYYE